MCDSHAGVLSAKPRSGPNFSLTLLFLGSESHQTISWVELTFTELLELSRARARDLHTLFHFFLHSHPAGKVIILILRHRKYSEGLIYPISGN